MSTLGRHFHLPLDERRIRTIIALIYVAAILALYSWFIVSHPTRDRVSVETWAGEAG